MFSDEDRLCLNKVDGRVRAWRRPGERFADCCIDRVTVYGGGSVIGLGWHLFCRKDKTRGHQWNIECSTLL